ncbi:16S rRNA (uracil(1498)-N(3))-methyltransferase [Bordetella hinzii]|uniref:Ribosomal RNA small subunit methyltransferase E n=2 Tax=Bordetella hinzii TaxID=103855 RepID=A0AAN1RSX4_9BORD|nr:16S rRNA (uracil(1498)-N(3))-methyltransferase [Bordetella hinzii]AKQ54820.1 Ribosomal RNA small subunit methyltransferase E [Bordetella hinzii]AKQ59333.1 Ribosomal RNA small subunit methyltransferase E [Bordetella hinzii]AZW15424.1 16S rRNA (uracil(1498)-N(3))-methyltransferase [Bordetella hinzii]KCB25085.1 RNA methyltransferase, RsmE family [Bordetella hinzii OH87 BAL007II]KCB27110.1 RNA methyltransferase, RsmE family [Bordetella hinzii CA90 BAL1384]
MSLPRFYCDTPLAAGQRLPLPDALAHHAIRVLRLRDGADIVLFDGRGGEYPARLEIEGRTGHAQLGPHLAREAELPGRIVLVQGLPSGDKMDWIVEKAVELGAAAVVPIAAQRSVLQLSGPRLEKRLAHWRRVAQSAAEQCGRNRLTEVAAPQTLRDWLARPAEGLRLMCHPQAADDLPGWLARQSAPAALTLMVGPEGGWSEEEIAAARTAGVASLRLGPRVLRTETAGLALIASVSALLGWN